MCVSTECESIHRQCNAGPSSTSAIFVDGVVSPESVPAGLFVRALAEVIQSDNDARPDERTFALSNCIHALTSLQDLVLATITLPCPDPRDGAFIDPRPTLTEAWLQAMIALAESRSVDPAVEALLVQSCVAMVSLILYSSLGKTVSERMNDPGMSLDGPQSLAMTTFLGAFFRIGAGVLQAAGQRLLCTVPVNIDSVQGLCQDRNFQGVAVIGAALFRSCQGSLPPWAIESIPEVYSSLFEALGEDVEAFGLLMQLSMELRLSRSETGQGFGGVAAGQLLSGRFFENMSDNAKVTFIGEAKQLSKKGGDASWRRLKGLIKQACGGKKKETDFNQKPSPTRWEFERV